MTGSAAYPSFAHLFQRGTTSPVPLYLALLRPGPHLEEAGDAIRAATRLSGTRTDDEVGAMLAASNWRPQLVGAVSVVVLGANDARLAALWAALGRPSWVSPQIAGAAMLTDPEFVARSREVLARAVVLAPNEIGAMAWQDRHSALGGESEQGHADKLISALLALCQASGTEEVWVRDHTARADIRTRLERDGSRGGEIATRWVEGIEALRRGRA